ncbi:MAG: M23 family metallopeptidase [Bacteroidota bacterium]|nr:M23 family metallopeptidase [Bacteroidota bacterium]
MGITGKYTRKIISILLITVGFSHVSNGQTVVIDTSNFIKKINFEPSHNNDTSRGKYFSGDFIFLPPELLKNDHWDTLNVRTRYYNTDPTAESGTIVLNNPNENPFVYPYKGKVISPFGFRGHRIHTGIDIKLNHNDTVLCAFDGVVRMARYYGGYGNAVVVRHFNGLETLYGHLAKISVKVNELVHAGDLIGLGGRTGRATTDHLHFETRYQGEPFNPQRILDVVDHTLLCDTLFISNGTFTKSGKSSVEPRERTAMTKGDKKSRGKKHKEDLVSKGKKKYHTVKPGDNLSEIAEKYGITTTKLCQLNGLKKNKLLQLGKKIRVN